VYNNFDTLFTNGQNNVRIFSTSAFCISPLSLDSLLLINGFTTGSGGAILVNCENMHINNSIIRNCTANNGGAIAYEPTYTFCGAYDYSNMTNSYVANTTITNCHATQNGRAIFAKIVPYIGYSWGPQPSYQGLNISHCNIFNNSATNGGSVYIKSQNTAYPSPSAYSYLNVNYSTLAFNSCTGNGGAIYSFSENLNSIILKNATIVNNTATGNGGGVYNSSLNYIDTVFTTNTTICFNNSSGSGRAIYNVDNNSNVKIKGSIVAFIGVGSYNNNINNSALISPVHNNIIDDIYLSNGINFYYTTIPLLNLGTLQNNGDNTKTMLPQTGSIAIDNGVYFRH